MILPKMNPRALPEVADSAQTQKVVGVQKHLPGATKNEFGNSV
jgi:hypothetical protein